MRADGACPACGRAVDAGRAHPPGPRAPGAPDADSAPDPSQSPGPSSGALEAGVKSEGDGSELDDDRLPIPWHLWLLLAALAVYLGYRTLQGLEWLFGF